MPTTALTAAEAVQIDTKGAAPLFSILKLGTHIKALGDNLVTLESQMTNIRADVTEQFVPIPLSACMVAHGAGMTPVSNLTSASWATSVASTQITLKHKAEATAGLCLSVPLPDAASSTPFTVYVRAKMSGATDTPKLVMDLSLNEAAATGASSDAVTSVYQTLSMAVANLGAAAGSHRVSLSIVPSAHTTDAVVVSGVWLKYNRAIA
jgi:hypothetical protein